MWQTLAGFWILNLAIGATLVSVPDDKELLKLKPQLLNQQTDPQRAAYINYTT